MAAKIITAIIESGAQLGADVEIGVCPPSAPRWCSAAVRFHHHAAVEGNTHIGGRRIFPFACIGGKTRDLKFRAATRACASGSGNVFREYVTIHAAIQRRRHDARLGSDNVLLGACHIAHDRAGSHIIMSNGGMVAGHVVIEDHVVVGGNGGIHQFCRIGAYAMLSATAKLVHDPRCISSPMARPPRCARSTRVGLERNGFTPAQLDRVKAGPPYSLPRRIEPIAGARKLGGARRRRSAKNSSACWPSAQASTRWNCAGRPLRRD